MKLEPLADNYWERIGLLKNQIPIPIVQVFPAIIQARAIMAAVRFRVFDGLGSGKHTLQELCYHCCVYKEPLRLLLNVLIAAGYVSMKKNNYVLTKLAQDTMLPGSSTHLADFIEFNYFHWQAISQFEHTLRTGKKLDYHKEISKQKLWEPYQRAMLDLARPIADILAKMIPVRRRARQLLDIGGSHGLFAARICQRHRKLKATVLELPQAVNHAKLLAEEEEIDQIVSFKSGDILATNTDNDTYDNIFIGNLLHHFTAQQNQQILKIAYEILNPKGYITIWEFISGESDSANELAGSALALYFYSTSSSELFTLKDYKDWLTEAGFRKITVKKTIKAPIYRLIIARK